MADNPNTTRLPPPEQLPAVWIGYEAGRWFPFDPFVFLERMAMLGAPVVLTPDKAGVWYASPAQGSGEYDFLTGWHNGCPGAAAMVAKALRENAELQAAHLALCTHWRQEWDAARTGGDHG